MLGLVHIHVHNLLVRVLSSRHTLKTERRVTKPHHALSHTHTHTHAHTHLHIDTHTHRIASLCCSTPSQRWSLFLSHDTLLMPPCTLMHTTVLPCTAQCTPQSCTPQSCTARCAPQSCTPQCCHAQHIAQHSAHQSCTPQCCHAQHSAHHSHAHHSAAF